ncbi:unnamed protein product [Pleuronectes platessa]|uniref:Uncharacterized protein n=1 Tax=Pleuronectes platessa TaxID=8262 RepID=A0A9N7YAS8_PLEPL|nr:unnamed protein product [Pleuronectes platessa]
MKDALAGQSTSGVKDDADRVDGLEGSEQEAQDKKKLSLSKPAAVAVKKTPVSTGDWSDPVIFDGYLRVVLMELRDDGRGSRGDDQRTWDTQRLRLKVHCSGLWINCDVPRA